LEVITHKAKRGSRVVYNVKTDLFPKTGPKEMCYSACQESLMMTLANNLSFRKSEEILNRLRWQDDGNRIKFRTLADVVERNGREIINHIDEKAMNLLEQHQFDPKTGQPIESQTVEKSIAFPATQLITENKVQQAISEYNAGREKEGQIDQDEIHGVFEDAEQSVNMSVDDVGVTEQKPSGRTTNCAPKESKHYVQNTVVHIQQNKQKYVLDGLGIRKTLIVLVAFLLNNDLLLNKALMFFTDGAESIKNPIRAIFGWRPYRIILDWYHLKKKCGERLSMAMKGRELRNTVLKKLISLLWLGKMDAAVEYLRNIDPVTIKNSSEIDKLIAYFTKNRDYIPCYALRQQLGLRNSSNRGEKANDLVVAQRQKHNGMSWSKAGSSALANIKAMFLNKEDHNWHDRRQLAFKLISASPNKCA